MLHACKGTTCNKNKTCVVFNRDTSYTCEKVIVPRGSKGGGTILNLRATYNLNTYFRVG